MSVHLDNIIIENFKSYRNRVIIPAKDLSVFMGANSSGKSTALQTLLILKQTVECNSPDIDLLLSGKYVTVGDYTDVVNDLSIGNFSIGLTSSGDELQETYGGDGTVQIVWNFKENSQGGVYLSTINMTHNEAQINLSYENEHKYGVQINGKKTPLSVQINNLLPRKVYVKYNNDYNILFYSFLEEIYKWIVPKKRADSLMKNKLVSIKTVDDLYLKLIGKVSGDKKKTQKDYLEKCLKIAARIKGDIKKYSDYQLECLSGFSTIPDQIRDTIIYSCIIGHDDLEQLSNILDKYEKLYDEFIINEKKRVYDRIEQFEVNMLYTLGKEGKDSSIEAEAISDIFRKYNEIFTDIFSRIFYLGPIREKPQGLYNIGFETIPKYVGPTGAYFASVLLRENKQKKYFLPMGEEENMSLLEALDEWVDHLNVASSVQVEKKNSFGFSVSISNTQQKKSDIMNVGIGTSQVLPVLITGLLSEKGEYLLFEQPELHLHPYSQSRLADFFVELIKRGRKIIVETHSEYFILRLRYQILINNINDKDIAVNFFQNNGTTEVSQGIISGYGNLKYPDDFRDETQKLLEDLMKAALEKRG